MAKKPVVAIVGRPNVGKSTLFNRLVRERKAIVHDLPGVTRDRLYGTAAYADDRFDVIDTGGLELEHPDVIRTGIRDQALMAIDESDILIFIINGVDGVMPLDQELCSLFRSMNKPMIVAVNKMDVKVAQANMYDAYSLGVDYVCGISAEHDRGIDELIDAIENIITLPESVEEEEHIEIRLAIVGRPNVGKSSMVNRLIGEERVVVSDIPGTTRDAVDIGITYYGKPYTLIDTAGIRRLSQLRKAESVEKLSAFLAERALQKADVVALVVDATEIMTAQDVALADKILDSGRPMIIIVNKWDLVLEKETHTAKQYEDELRHHLRFADFCPILFASALTGQRMSKVFDMAEKAKAAANYRMSTSEVNNLLDRLRSGRRMPSRDGRLLKIYFGSQIGTKPPAFIFKTNMKQGLIEEHRRFLKNRIREFVEFYACPIRIMARHHRESDEDDTAPRSKPKPKLKHKPKPRH